MLYTTRMDTQAKEQVSVSDMSIDEIKREIGEVVYMAVLLRCGAEYGGIDPHAPDRDGDTLVSLLDRCENVLNGYAQELENRIVAEMLTYAVEQTFGSGGGIS